MQEKLKKLMSELTELTGLVDFYLEESSKLEKKDSEFIIADMDDTLISRSRITEEEPILREKRWQEWNKAIINDFGINYIVDKFYRKEEYPDKIRKKMQETDSLILTAWVYEYAMMKYKASWLWNIPIRVVRWAQDKIIETIKYVIFELWYIPKKITIYEDRVDFFIKYKELIEWCLWTELEIYLVEMNWNNWYKKIEKVSK